MADRKADMEAGKKRVRPRCRLCLRIVQRGGLLPNALCDETSLCATRFAAAAATHARRDRGGACGSRLARAGA